ncbi:PAS domain-containing protein [Marinomonas sp. A79]|uniref:PAS domain-containing protein n=1 Tax=Marinomonas vulgaris TaxID=2823372 RepID=A0ABS5H9K6_9GAMM|nr:PAS domain-containing protein [Marinomonas vulgaris]MBR7888357.1 PAS domain-containing protein [Marinomonas vulgaris]
MSKEITFLPEELIVSKTDLKGKITYSNRAFMRICNFPESALLNQPHNLIRHQDMPRGVFYGMWQALQAGNEFFGFIKNSTSDGNYYWVFANVTPDYVGEQKVGYYSVRRVAPPNALTAVADLYKKMREIEASGDKTTAAKKSWQWLNNYCQEKAGMSYDAFILNHYQSFRQ